MLCMACVAPCCYRGMLLPYARVPERHFQKKQITGNVCTSVDQSAMSIYTHTLLRYAQIPGFVAYSTPAVAPYSLLSIKFKKKQKKNMHLKRSRAF